jgi:hypothetical protein
MILPNQARVPRSLQIGGKEMERVYESLLFPDYTSMVAKKQEASETAHLISIRFCAIAPKLLNRRSLESV